MEIKPVYQNALFSAEKSAALFVVIFLCFFISGCMSNPAPPQTLDDFRNASEQKRNKPHLLNGKLLTLENAIKTALINNPTNQAAIQAVYAAKYGYFQALSAYLPQIDAKYSLANTLARGWNLKNPPEGMLKKNDHLITAGSIQATFLLFDGFARELDSIIAHQEYRKSIEVSKNVKRLLIRAVAFAYYDMYLAEEEIRIYREDLDFQNEALQQADQQFRSGHVSKASVLNFKILAAKAKSNISNAQYRKKTALYALLSLMGCNAENTPEYFELQQLVPEIPPPVHDDEFYLELAVNNRPDLKEVKILLDIASRNKQKVYAEFLPVIKIFSDLSFNTYNANYRFTDAHGNQRAFAYGAEGTWNIFNGFKSFNNLRKQKVLEKIAMWKISSKFLEIAAEVKDACSNCKNAHFQITVFKSMAEWVREQRDLVFSEYRNGRETITRLNEAQNTLVEAQCQLVISAIQFNKAIAQLAAVTATTDQSNSLLQPE